MAGDDNGTPKDEAAKAAPDAPNVEEAKSSEPKKPAKKTVKEPTAAAAKTPVKKSVLIKSGEPPKDAAAASAPANAEARSASAPETPAPVQVRRKITDLKDLGDAVEAGAGAAPVTVPADSDSETAGAVLREPQRDAQGRAYGTGRRKDAVARVWVKPGQGRITVNGRESDVYFARPVLRMLIAQPLVAARRETEFDIVCTVKGGGLSGQAGAVRHGISRALVNYEPDLRGVLKSGGFMTRDSRVVERKKYGRAKARRSFQFSKR